MITEAPERNLMKELDDILLEGEENSITGTIILKELGLKDTRKFRRLMVEMRHNDIPVIGGNKGYFKANNVNEIQAAREKLLKYIKSLCIDLRDLKRIKGKFMGQLPLL